MILRVALASVLSRKLTVVLSVLSIAVSVALLLGVEHIRSQAKHSFSKTVSGVDLIIGARSGPINLLLYSVFHLGSATHTVSWQSYQELAGYPEVAWSIPLSLGDSHKGFQVLGTTADYFTHFRYGAKQTLEFAQGRAFAELQDAVLGADVARTLGYTLNQPIVLSHGAHETLMNQHDDQPFKVVGILLATGTPVDQTIVVDVKGIAAIHEDWRSGMHLPGHREAERVPVSEADVTLDSISAFMVGLHNKAALFAFQRTVNQYANEALLAIIPGVGLMELWRLLGGVENLLHLISLLVLSATFLGFTALLLTSMQEREREIAVLRAIGAHAWSIFFLMELEALLITLMGVLLGSSVLWLGLKFGSSWLSAHYGLFIEVNPFNPTTLRYLAGIFVLAALLAMLPSYRAYKTSLGKSLSTTR